MSGILACEWESFRFDIPDFRVRRALAGRHKTWAAHIRVAVVYHLTLHCMVWGLIEYKDRSI